MLDIENKIKNADSFYRKDNYKWTNVWVGKIYTSCKTGIFGFFQKRNEKWNKKLETFTLNYERLWGEDTDMYEILIHK